MCAACGEAYVYPVTWAESGPADWWLLLRCGSCGESRDIVVSNAMAAEYDSRLDAEMSAIHAAANRLQHEALAGDADTLAAALRLDLLGADDFR